MNKVRRSADIPGENNSRLISEQFMKLACRHVDVQVQIIKLKSLNRVVNVLRKMLQCSSLLSYFEVCAVVMQFANKKSEFLVNRIEALCKASRKSAIWFNCDFGRREKSH